MEQQIPAILKTKPHFEILDGLRGVAALSVVTFHFMEMAITDYSKNFIGHGFLAVDFFFCLSGFVIAYAYDDRIGKMGVTEFFKSRLIRLHPLVIMGSVLGLLTFLFDPFGGHPELYSAGRIALIFLCSVLLIPFPVVTERAFNLFNLNAPAWSLFWEYIANIFYAFILSKLNKRWLLALTLLAAIPICIIAYRTGNLMGGWSGGTFWDGGARVAYSFLAGMLVYRFNWIIPSKLGFGMMSVLVFAAFIMPFSGWNWLTEPLAVLFYFPLIVALGAGARLSERLRKICVFSGKMSYPLYMTHYAALWMFGNYYASHKPGTVEFSVVVVTSIILLVGVAWLVMTFYDIPVRRYLSRKRHAA
ncbi:acyltransferase [Mucilaginibacter sp.]|jgi:peptidoglycan/LPS O-acetylase OafA/YrhL|uniref:acyltransferase family protein n=1 Tax=Mucilaginibacter sp. TaxID=1882438 RepID=UPI002CF575D6|nr:acyltransferase [Mucilaginibacter sp.]HTI61083.1 acyltransferase [Mucilaginibacter sp.]